MTAKIATVIVNYQHSEDAVRCVASLRRSAHLDQHIIVVDNGSSQAARDALARALDTPTILETGANLGFAGGCNVGIRHALQIGADYVWLVNPDITTTPEALSDLVTIAETRPDAGIVGCTVTYGASVPPKVWFGGGVIDWQRGGATHHRDDGTPVRDTVPGIIRATDYVTGACMMVRSAVFEDVGLLPERYFLYYEETDFNVRAARQGWRILMTTTPLATHYKRSTGGLPAPYYVYYYLRSRVLFGTAFTDLPAEHHAADAGDWISAWRKRVSERAPAWRPVYEHLVTEALADGVAGVTGPRADIHEVPRAEAAA